MYPIISFTSRFLVLRLYVFICIEYYLLPLSINLVWSLSHFDSHMHIWIPPLNKWRVVVFTVAVHVLMSQLARKSEIMLACIVNIFSNDVNLHDNTAMYTFHIAWEVSCITFSEYALCFNIAGLQSTLCSSFSVCLTYGDVSWLELVNCQIV